MVRRIFTPNDEYAFLRARAAELLDEGAVEEARRLTNAIDLAQIRWIAAALKKQGRPRSQKKSRQTNEDVNPTHEKNCSAPPSKSKKNC